MKKKNKETCTKCNRLCKHANINCMSGSGPKSDIMFVGEAPGKDEDDPIRGGKPFIGRVGRYWKKHILRHLDIDREKVRVENAVRCRPPGNKKPNIGEVRNCYPYLEASILYYKPKAVVAMGNAALNSLISINRKKSDEKEKRSAGVTGITRWRGKKLWHSELNCWVIPTWHPSAVFRDNQDDIHYKFDQTIDDVSLALFLSEQSRPLFVKPKSFLIQSAKKAIRVMQGVMQSPVYAIDSETNAFDRRKDEVLGISLSDRPERGFYILWDVIEKNSDVREAFNYLLSRKDRVRVFHNGSYDEKFFVYNGFKRVGKYYDTMLMANLLDENFSKSLKDLVWRYLTFGGYDKPMDDYRRDHRISNFRDIPVNLMFKYASLDAVATLRLYFIFRKMLKKQRIWQHFISRQMPARRVLTQVEMDGFSVNRKYSERLLKEATSMVDLLESRIYKIAGHEFNINSRKQLPVVLFDELGLPVIKRTKTGGRCTDKNVMKQLSKLPGKGGKLSKTLRKRSKARKSISTFIKPVIRQTWDDGKLRTFYNLMGTVTGRCSSGIHNIPRDRAIRTQFVADKGCLLLVTDIKSAELRVLAHYSREEMLIKAFNEGRDIHNETYNLMFGMPHDYVPTEDERFIAKTISFGLIYGRGARALAELLGVTVEEAYDLIDQYFEALPKAKLFLDNTVDFAKKHGYVVSMFGRRRRLPNIQFDDWRMVARASRQAKNSLIQGTAAEITFLVMVRVFKQLKKMNMQSRIVHTVHDSVIINVPLSEVKAVENIVKEQFALPIPDFTVKLAIDIDKEKKWGAHKDSAFMDLWKELKGKVA